MQIVAAMRSASSAIAGRVQLRVLHQCARRRQRVRAAGTDGQDAVVRLNQIAGAGDQVRALGVRDDEKGLQLAQVLVHPPVLRQLDDRALHVAAVLLELRLEAGKEREGVGRGAGEAGQDLVVIEAPHLGRAVLHDGRADRHLPVARHRHRAVAAHAEDGRRSNERFVHEAGSYRNVAMRTGRRRRGGTFNAEHVGDRALVPLSIRIRMSFDRHRGICPRRRVLPSISPIGMRRTGTRSRRMRPKSIVTMKFFR